MRTLIETEQQQSQMASVNENAPVALVAAVVIWRKLTHTSIGKFWDTIFRLLIQDNGIFRFLADRISGDIHKVAFRVAANLLAHCGFCM